MAEFVLKDMVQREGMKDMYIISSSATSTEEIWNGIGNPVYPPARDELAKHNIDCAGKRATLLKKEDYEKYDVFYCMDKNNYRNVLRIFGSDTKSKVKMLLERDVADPWYTGDFASTYKDIYEGCKAIINEGL